MNQDTCSTSSPSFFFHALNRLGWSSSFPALSWSEGVNDTLVAHCVINHPMSSCFIAMSCSCCIPLANQMIDHCFTLKENVKIRNLLSVDHFTCGTIFHTRKTMAANPMPRRFGYEHLSVIWLWSSPVFRLVVSAAWSFSEQCKLLSACGVSFQLSFQQVEFCSQLLWVALCRSLYLKHDYVAISNRTRFHHRQILLLCYLVFSCRLMPKTVHLIIFLFASSLASSSQCRLRVKRKLVLPCSSSRGHTFSNTNDQR